MIQGNIREHTQMSDISQNETIISHKKTADMKKYKKEWNDKNKEKINEYQRTRYTVRQTKKELETSQIQELIESNNDLKNRVAVLENMIHNDRKELKALKDFVLAPRPSPMPFNPFSIPMMNMPTEQPQPKPQPHPQPPQPPQFDPEIKLFGKTMNIDQLQAMIDNTEKKLKQQQPESESESESEEEEDSEIEIDSDGNIV